MRRLLFLLPVLLALPLLLLLFREKEPERAPRPRFLHEGESMRTLPEGAWQAEGEARRRPAVLRGRVLFEDEPVVRAEVAAVRPKPYQLAFTGKDGSYELTFERWGRYLVEASLTTDLAPQRAVIAVPEEGDPPPLDFHLQPAGRVFGEVVVEEEPLADGMAEIFVLDLEGDRESAIDTGIDQGFFNFYWPPPRDLPLELVVTSKEGYLTEPLRFTYTGEQVNLGRIRLARYPSVRLRMRLPDGTYAEDVVAAKPERIEVDERGDLWPGALVGQDSRLTVPAEGNVTLRVVLQEQREPRDGDPPRHTLLRELELALNELRQVEVVVRPGPFSVRRRLVDEHGAPLAARVRRAGGPVAETAEDGGFALEVPHGGLFALFVAELHVPPHGWLPLRQDPLPHVLLDADADRAPCTLALDGRVLLVASAPAAVMMERQEGSATWGHVSFDDTPPGMFAVLSRALAPGAWRWKRGAPVPRETANGLRYLGWEFPPLETAPVLEVAARGWTLLDLR